MLTLSVLVAVVKLLNSEIRCVRTEPKKWLAFVLKIIMLEEIVLRMKKHTLTSLRLC